VTLWESRDLPVLRALVATQNHEVRSGYLFLGGGVAREKLGVDLEDADVGLALLTLRDADYIEVEDSQPYGGESGSYTHLLVTGRGMQALGEWPFFTEMTPATLAELLERFAEEAATEDESTNARRAAAYLRTLPEAAFRASLRTVMIEGTKALLGVAT
jgi:hypothetical protein